MQRWWHQARMGLLGDDPIPSSLFRRLAKTDVGCQYRFLTIMLWDLMSLAHAPHSLAGRGTIVPHLACFGSSFGFRFEPLYGNQSSSLPLYVG
jgi:hypothetical protein